MNNVWIIALIIMMSVGKGYANFVPPAALSSPFTTMPNPFGPPPQIVIPLHAMNNQMNNQGFVNTPIQPTMNTMPPMMMPPMFQTNPFLMKRKTCGGGPKHFHGPMMMPPGPLMMGNGMGNINMGMGNGNQNQPTLPDNPITKIKSKSLNIQSPTDGNQLPATQFKKLNFPKFPGAMKNVPQRDNKPRDFSFFQFDS
jgi:hypothetical protein